MLFNPDGELVLAIVDPGRLFADLFADAEQGRLGRAYVHDSDWLSDESGAVDFVAYLVRQLEKLATLALLWTAEALRLRDSLLPAHVSTCASE